MGSPQLSRRAADHLAPGLAHLRAHLLQGFQVQVDWPAPQFAPTGGREPDLAAAGKDRAEVHHRGAHFQHQRVGNVVVVHPRGVDEDRSAVALHAAA